MLKERDAFSDVYEFRKVLKDYVIQEGFNIKRAQQQGYLIGCRPFIDIDGCFLNGPYGGVLLAVVSVDANNGFFPLAVDVCEGENSESWGWFLELLMDSVGEIESRIVICMTDRQKGILNALAKIWPNSHVKYCGRHVYANMRSKFPSLLLRSLFWSVARATNIVDFKQETEQIKQLDSKAWECLNNIPAKHWSRYAFNMECKVDHVTNNSTESFNLWIECIRGKPILQMLEDLRRMIMERISSRKHKDEMWESDIPPPVQKRLDDNATKGRLMRVIFGRANDYEVLKETVVVVVNLYAKSCDCGMWQCSGVPCNHVMAIIMNIREEFGKFIDVQLKKHMYINTYSVTIHPIPR
ncbi:uncharacterized protein LOC127809356 [Diospyros lotus]|uniref:uncharacterized protein LOC127809356 n=1 Tax=Diospyros lotus TaxID=55363 RepID=UPI00225028E4|nr:uncharacterized protein LOC127809356 [Diospyros lotus]